MSIIILLLQFLGMLTLILVLECFLLPSLKRINRVILYLFTLFSGTILAILLGQMTSAIFLIGGSIIIILSKDSNHMWNLILLQISWFVSILTDYFVTIPLRILGYDFNAIRTSLYLVIFYSLFHAFLAVLPSILIGKWVHQKFNSYMNVVSLKMQRLLFCEISICSCIFLTNIIFGSLYNYPTEILLFNGFLFFFFAIANFLIFLSLYGTLQENKRLALKTQEQEILRSYTEKLESHYQDMRRFKHDYMNILATMTCYIQENDMEKLKHYFDQHIVPSSRLLVNNDAIISKLSNIKVLEVKGILYTKLVQAMNQNLNISLELTQEITSINMNSSALSLMLGIFLDNAIEAAAMTEARILHIALVKKDNGIIFHLENSTLPLTRPLDQLCEPGVTTKKDHNGLGLCTVKELLAAMPNVQFYMTCEEGKIKQVLTIPG